MSKNSNRTFASAVTVTILWAVAFSASLLFVDCINNSDGDTAIPRRTAYPRIEVYDSTYSPIKHLPINIEANAHALVHIDSMHTSTDGNRWIDIVYPAYNATLHCTYSPADVASISGIIGNRSERMSLNAGDLTSELTEISTPSGTTAHIVNTPSSNVTPVQFVASDNRSWVFSGALYLNSPGNKSNADSIAPVLKAVNRDIMHLIRNLYNSGHI